MLKTRYFAAAALAVGITLPTTQPAQAYPIDCAILLCLAGGFPSNTECNAARAEFIRRITPWPVEPPLQLWRCPMGLPANFTPAPNAPRINLGRDGLTPEVRRYRDAIEIYHIRQYSRRTNNDGDELVTDIAQRGFYDEDGRHHWTGASYERGPAWLAEAVGGRTIPIRECVREHRENGCMEYRVVGQENRAGWGGFGTVRGVAIRYEDHTGETHMHYVRY